MKMHKSLLHNSIFRTVKTSIQPDSIMKPMDDTQNVVTKSFLKFNLKERDSPKGKISQNQDELS